MNQVMDLPSVFDVATAPNHLAMIERDVMGEDADERIDDEGQAEDDCASPIIEDIGRIACAGCPLFSGCLKPKAVAFRELKQADGEQLTDEIQHEDTGDTILLVDEAMLTPKASYIKELLDEETEVVVATYEPPRRSSRECDQKQKEKSARRLPQKPPADKPTAQRATLRREGRQETAVFKQPSLPPPVTTSIPRVVHDEAPPLPIKEDESRQDALKEAVTPPRLALPRSECSVEQSVVDIDVPRLERSAPRLEQSAETSIDETVSLVQELPQQSPDQSATGVRHVADAPERVPIETFAKVPTVTAADPQSLVEQKSTELSNAQPVVINDTAELIKSDPESSTVDAELTTTDETVVSAPPLALVVPEEQIVQLDIPIDKAAPRLEVRHEIQHDGELQPLVMPAGVEDEAESDGEMLDDQDEYELADEAIPEAIPSDPLTVICVEETPRPMHDREVTPEPLVLPPPVMQAVQPSITPPVEKVYIDHVDSSLQTTEKPISSPPPTELAVTYREIDTGPMAAPLVSPPSSEQIDPVPPEQPILVPPEQPIAAPLEQVNPSPIMSSLPRPEYTLEVLNKDEDQPIAEAESLFSIDTQPLACDDAKPTVQAIDGEQPPVDDKGVDTVVTDVDNPEHKQAAVGLVSTAIFGSIQLGMVAVWLTMARLGYTGVTVS